MAKTPTHNVRIDPDLWQQAGEVADALGTDRGAVIRAFLRWYVRRPGADLPPRPEGRP